MTWKHKSISVAGLILFQDGALRFKVEYLVDHAPITFFQLLMIFLDVLDLNNLAPFVLM